MDLSVVTAITLASMVLMFSFTSPELSWDEADYVASITHRWGFLWGGFNYERHSHGPMAMYLAKLGEDALPAAAGPIEFRLRFFGALVGSLAVGFLYWALRRSFGTSRPAALAGAGLLLFSVIRVDETNIIGPHEPMLASILAIVALGYQWRDRPSMRAAIGLGMATGFGALAMTYVIPAIICWAVSVGLAGREWFAWDRKHFKVSWFTPLMLAVAAIFVAILWPPGALRHVIITDFRIYLHYPIHPTLVGDRIFEIAPRWVAAYWLAHFEAPLLVFSIPVILVAVWKAHRRGRFSPKHGYLAVSLAFLLGTALTAHIAGSRNLLLFLAVLCLAAGALFDEAFGEKPRLAWCGSAAVNIFAALNLAWFSMGPNFIPYLATDGYREFLKANPDRVREKARAVVYGLPVLKFYARQDGTPIAWEASEIPWTTRADAPLAADVKYVLIPGFVYNDMPPDQPMRRVVAAHWKVVWSYEADHCWELRLYENPQAPGL